MRAVIKGVISRVAIVVTHAAHGPAFASPGKLTDVAAAGNTVIDSDMLLPCLFGLFEAPSVAAVGSKQR